MASKALFGIIFFVLSTFTLTTAKIHSLTITDDERKAFSIETFGFAADGVISISVPTFTVSSSGSTTRYGFVVRKTDYEDAGDASYLDESMDLGCLLDDEAGSTIIFNLKPGTPLNEKGVIKPTDAGLYRVIFAACGAPEGSTVSFKLDLTMYNPGPEYLSVGERPLSSMYFAFSFVFLAFTGLWGATLRKYREKTHRVHLLMLVVLVLKTITVFFRAFSVRYEMKNGTNSGWRTLYLIFAFVKGTLLFVCILLIGTGWSLLKPYLNDQEKRVLKIVLFLQVIDNIALIVVNEIAPGSQAAMSWSDVLHLVDIICCCAILFPIVWSIRNLRIAAQADGQQSRSLEKLTQFRQFYMTVVAYIYFTRIIVYFLAATLSYTQTWMTFCASELASVAFFAFTGYKFSPQADNPYLQVHDSDDEDETDPEAAFGDVDAGSEMTMTRREPKKDERRSADANDASISAELQEGGEL